MAPSLGKLSVTPAAFWSSQIRDLMFASGSALSAGQRHSLVFISLMRL